jgi:hypothetical protein
MNKNFNHDSNRGFSRFRFIFLGINFGAAAQQDAGGSARLETNRRDAISPSPKTSPSPTPTVSPYCDADAVRRKRSRIYSRASTRARASRIAARNVGIKIAALDTNKVFTRKRREILDACLEYEELHGRGGARTIVAEFSFYDERSGKFAADASGAI